MSHQTLTGYPSIDRPWLKYYSKEAINTPMPKCSIYEYLYENNKNYMNDIAILYFGKKITYKKLFSEIARTEKALLQNGVRFGDNITICMPAVPETYYLILALNKIGANANLLNPTFTEQQLSDRIAETGSKLLFIVNELYSRVENIAQKVGIERIISCPAVNSLGFLVKKIKKVKSIKNTTTWNEFLNEGRKCTIINSFQYRENIPAITVYSSGTTGASKGILHTNESVLGIVMQYPISNFEIERGKIYFAQIPIWFSTGIIVTMLTPLCCGVTVLPVPVYDFKVFDTLIAKYKPNYIVSAGAFIEYLATAHPVCEACRSFKYLIAGGDYVTPHTEQFINKWLEENGADTKLHKGYGMCECGGTVTSTADACNKIGSAGIPMPKMTVAAFDIQTGRELKYGERGELRVITPGRMLGYYKNKEATESYFYEDKDGNTWACTGDMGYVDEDGVVYVSGRISDSYCNQKNELIYLFDIERAVADNKNVKQCKAITAEVNGKLTHVANVVLHKNDPAVFDEIMAECRKKLPENHLPKYFKVYENALPVAPSGKLDTVKMREEAVDLVEM